MLRVIERVKFAAYTKVYAIFACAITLTIAGVISISNTTPASADTTNINYNVSVAPALTLTTTTNSMVLNLDPSTKTFDSKNITVGVGTNNKTGYTLTLSTPQDSTDLTRDNSEDGVSGTMPTLAAGTYTQSTFTENKWGYKITSNTSIPSTVTTDYVPFTSGNTLMESDTAKNHDEASLTFAAKIDYLQASGSYSTTLNFHLVANPLATYMQDLDPTLCTTTPMTVVDKRDNQEYVIQHLADGNCWMMTNLNLGAETLTQDLTSDNTNCATSGSTACVATDVSGTPTLTAANFNSYKKTSSSRTFYWPEYVSSSGTDPTSNTPYGTLYNYCAASAGTICPNANTSGDAQYDICPAGWRLPTSGDGFGEFYNLYSQSAYNTNAKMRAPYASANGGAAFALAGYLDSTPVSQGSSSYYWASTRADNAYMYALSLNTSQVTTNNMLFRYYGASIRCVLKPQSMQSFTAAQASAMSIGDKAVLSDSRDGETYTVAKLKDGNIWMTQNLRLDPTAVTLDKLQGNTNAPDEVLSYFKNGGGSSPYPSSGVSSAWTSSSQNSYNLPYINASYKNTTQAASGSSPAGITGVYYNYCAATAGSYCYASNAGSGNAQYDICPSGWKMPSGGTEKGSYSYLYTHATEGYNSDVAQFQSALSTPLSGYFYSGSASDQGSYGYFWSSTYYDGNNMYYLYVDSSSVSPQNNYGRRSGLSVRCILQ